MPEIAGYRLTRVLGAGGMSTVYLGEQRSLGREVAIKVMLPDALTDEVSRRRFENEARTVARLDHPNIVGIHDVGRTGEGLPYYSMPHMAHGHLGQRDLRGKEPQVRAILQALLDALRHAHARGIVHRDVKAENVLFDDTDRPQLADFGIALRRGYGSRVTTAGLAVGSTAYMPPEQARGEPVDARADLYSVGVLAWEMLVGSLPYNAPDALSMAVMHVQDPIPRLPRELRHWQPFIDRALAKSPDRRFSDAAQMLAALDKVERGGRGPADVGHDLGKRLRAVPAKAWLVAGLVVAAGIGLASRDGAGPRAFYRAGGADAAAAAATAGDGSMATGIGDGKRITALASPDDALLRAAPESDAETWLVAAERQLRERKLTAPAGDNAYTSVLNAWQADSGHLKVAGTADALIAALALDAEREMQRGDDAAARSSVMQATQLASRTARSDGPALAGLRERTRKAISSRVDTAAAAYDRTAALAAVESGRRMGLDARALAALDTRARKIPLPGERIEGGSIDTVLVQQGGMRLAAMRRAVSRADFGEFAGATGREPARCRERASLLRVVAPRTWRSPGFDQGAGDAVVCVSWDDAVAYAHWAGKRDGRSYRLPTSSEWRRLPATAGGSRAVAEWNVDCSGSCEYRVTSGGSWRGDAGRREGGRGYDDVGFRLVRDL
ncbi:bifunctional serine/threonine-protein kinase/formylglycine-generating enzyme family protein [Luteimonas sp. MC1825]|uniref:bifunctional serine/threonine-protein kinase/formylglycine-generating enzyme family protein n=1 Tax=Luteimonas sp. MC1825 TaxID=2761107 RepID=UPI0016186F64|nr:bifunctional serine/threonine-protein kinase/formylglycine-generating enzyme family protein [Luteimonas sp. MC1825]MBB6599131.1 protein kinase [Luteimonas sp. MC1825]QOC89255.1 protein kinase [Luteimonas sp. MC1825]